jgi:endonuclease/exonuclease/phosphatase (EEP) superfamily protein YafD
VDRPAGKKRANSLLHSVGAELAKRLWGLLRYVLALSVATFAGCVHHYDADQAIVLDRSSGPVVIPAGCDAATPEASVAADGSLDPHAISLITWNIHKNADPGWESDLSLFAAAHDLVLLQEAHIEPSITNILEASGHQWKQASAFGVSGRDTGVMTASLIRPRSACVLRQLEPILRLPKSAIVSRYQVRGRSDLLAVANIHSINFALADGAYRAQLARVVTSLAGHRGPIVFAGDLNTWTAGRKAVLEGFMKQLGLQEVLVRPDRRRRFLGKQIDYVFVRGLEVVNAKVIEVDSSDHNPVSVTLRIP